MEKLYDVAIVGAGAAGIIATIAACQSHENVLLIEKLPKIGAKLKATGGGRCNLTNTLDEEQFMKSFGKQGRFMSDALKLFDATALREFFHDLGVQTHCPDGFRIFPVTHDSTTILTALQTKLKSLALDIQTNCSIESIIKEDELFIVKANEKSFKAKKVIVSTGGLGYPTLGAEGDGYEFAKSLGHSVTSLHPAMMPLLTKEQWGAQCRADTIANATIKVDIKKYKKLKACGDLIFTKNGIRGPVVLDFARDVTPILDKHGEVPILVNLTKGMNEDQIYKVFKNHSTLSTLETMQTILPLSIAQALCNECEVNAQEKFKNLEGIKREKLVKVLAWTPLTIIGHEGFKHAMITRGGVSLKEIEPKTMQSKIISGLYFCGEVMDLDGPCGGYNLQWSFSSGYLAGQLYD
ncbi:NAD(P)/FAD-dependent oxidoreductase [Candidatus Marinarcus aquaticus]|uniref:Aminoacetone oxidase family FAD-binding enzyme n=1 Tax=Candidatus Marinarcus aquaticus TaxID=2044504 RepID=A0A4Q0XRS1_9BACT|nr:NAD(P)/FAD-dependent oxidoreductase [Candidatus Marinarcus aquaticus]RXJ60046.1 aminoacetone oxidase family FAD-binding enzyme [Candidatus Marinarcus aquaticus]